MSAPLTKRLRQHVRYGAEWLFPNRFATGPLSESTMYVAWRRIKVAAEFSQSGVSLDGAISIEGETRLTGDSV